MSDKPPFITTILKSHRITDYLAKIGHEPCRTYNNRIKYICPIHGPEKEPSFYVFEEDGIQSYKCFGCGSCSDVIDLCSAIEKISIKAAIKKLAYGLNIDSGADLDFFIKKYEENKKDNSIDDIEQTAFRISQYCHKYLSEVDFENSEVDFVEKINESVDKLIHSMDIVSIRKIEDIVTEGLFGKRLSEYRRNKQYRMVMKCK